MFPDYSQRFYDFDQFMYWLLSYVPNFYIYTFILLCILSMLRELLKWGRRF